VVFVAATYLLIKTQKNLTKLASFLNLVSAILVAVSLANIIYFEFSTGRITRLFENKSSNTVTKVEKLTKPKHPPDIYYLIFDRYASFETIETTYAHDLTEFKQYLTNKDFYIASRSHSNYPRTFLSLGSSLNMNYVGYLLEEVGEESGDETAAYYLLEDFKVQKLLKSVDYEYIHIGGWWEPTRKNSNADQNYFYSPFRYKYLQGLNEFSTKLLETTILSTFLNKMSERGVSEPLWGRTNHREGILFQFEKLNQVIKTAKKPKFVFAHFLLPHFPYVLDQNCNAIAESKAKRKTNKENYLSQLECANKKIKQTIDLIFETHESPPVIILQSDEGPDPILSSLNKKWQESTIGATKEKTGILNAHYLPGRKKEAEKALYPSITPVNSFRVIFNLYFEAKLDLLEDKIYMIESKKRPYKFFDFTEKLK
jgi:hypothetical protein